MLKGHQKFVAEIGFRVCHELWRKENGLTVAFCSSLFFWYMNEIPNPTNAFASYATSSRFSLYNPIRGRNRRPRFPFRPFHPIYSTLTSSLFSSSFFCVTFLFCFNISCAFLVAPFLSSYFASFLSGRFIPESYFVDRVVRLTLISSLDHVCLRCTGRLSGL